MLSEKLRRIDGVAREGDVAEEVGAALIDVDLHLDAVLFAFFASRDLQVILSHRPYSVLDDAGVAIAEFIVVRNHLFQVVVKFELAIF